jgi:hypothetical protein
LNAAFASKIPTPTSRSRAHLPPRMGQARSTRPPIVFPLFTAPVHCLSSSKTPDSPAVSISMPRPVRTPQCTKTPRARRPTARRRTTTWPSRALYKWWSRKWWPRHPSRNHDAFQCAGRGFLQLFLFRDTTYRALLLLRKPPFSSSFVTPHMPFHTAVVIAIASRVFLPFYYGNLSFGPSETCHG